MGVASSDANEGILDIGEVNVTGVVAPAPGADVMRGIVAMDTGGGGMGGIATVDTAPDELPLPAGAETVSDQ